MDINSYLAIATKVLERIAHNHTFAHYATDDIIQEGLILAWASYEDWDGLRPPENFLYKHLSRRLKNLFRKECRRSDSPCKICKKGKRCAASDGVNPCERHANWNKTQTARFNIVNMGPIKLNENGETCEDCLLSPNDTIIEDVAYTELVEKTRAALSVELRESFDSLMEGKKVSAARLARIQLEIKVICQKQ